MVYQKPKKKFRVHVILKVLFAMFCLFEHCSAVLKSCSDEEQPRICLTDKDGYVYPFPVILSTLLNIRDITEMNEDKSSISIHAELISFWKDPRLAASNSTK